MTDKPKMPRVPAKRTTAMISVRIPSDMLARLNREAKKQDRSRSEVIVAVLDHVLPGAKQTDVFA